MLAEAVQSVIAQDYEGMLATVVVYDTDRLTVEPINSSDETRRPVRWICSERRGLPAARNAGIAASTAPWVALLDDDDLWMPGKIRTQIAAATASTVLVATGIKVVDAVGRSTIRSAPHSEVSRRDLIADRVMELHPSGFLIRRSALEQIHGLDEDIPGGYAEDYDLLLRLAAISPLVAVEEALVTVRWTGGSYFFSRWRTISDALQYLLVKHPDFAASRRGQARVLGQIAFAEAAMQHRRVAVGFAARAARSNPREPRAVLAAAVALGFLSPERVQDALHRRGRGI